MSGDFEVCPPRSKRLKTEAENTDKRVLYVVLEQCSLESAKVGKDYVLLSSEKHANFLLKNRQDPATFRPDIVHQCLLNLLDSPLNRAGKLQVFIHTDKNVLIEVNPQCRIPRTYDRFAGLMVQLLHKLSLRASDSSQKLLSVIKNPVSEHLPVGCRKMLLSFSAPDLTIPNKMIATTENVPIAVVVGGIAKGKIDTDYTDTEMKISNYPLSAALTCAKITSGLEEIWGIL